jgi:hypothetical protein
MDQISNHPLYKVHTIDSAMSSLWDFYRKRFFPLFGISFVMGLILQYLSTLVNVTELQSLNNINEIMSKLKDYIWPMLLVSLCGLLFTTMLHYYVIYNPLDKENTIFRSLLKSLRYYIPYLIIVILLAVAGSFALFLGLLLLVIGILFAAIYIMTIYLFILPAMMVEGSNIASTITRSLTLAHRNFWSNIGWTAVFVIILLVVTTVLSGFILLPFTGTFLKAFTNPEEATALMEITTKPLYIVLSAILNAITFPLLPIFACILYFNGRAREEKQSESQLSNDYNDGKVRVEDLYAKPYSDENKGKPEDK